ncbi:transcriptional Coactivator p15-domain-containing protein [Lentinula raphanica]|uniref:Transcriptional Coactivator p15-domain-containing protein n=1 Tax=Lentinula raphanica TaxID=153919 RepID=A0AA38UF63_9AGAR|nr:transcriptional Coactivator p15-domain-containing protein [Lentinula raphanica]KAJ3821014.1 transcriptional Coactivator p15-domain-containing protein [Lentinula raphanica]KAJ3838996.1 transcriptional Coactivator p15-domain-containing protein [Lentinula raphanica]KAJ3966163.1 transcriptional Coactivator p15-domain-containing protein [Lentinula raphanica]
MAKRKTDQTSDSDSSSEAPVAPRSSKSKLERGIKKPKIAMNYNSESEQEDEEQEEQPKKKGKSKPVSSSSSKTPSVQKNSEGDKFISLGKNRRATVRSFKGSTFVDIREFYGDSEESMKPGKKGITLTPDQWEVLKSGISIIDELFAAEQKKK